MSVKVLPGGGSGAPAVKEKNKQEKMCVKMSFCGI